MMKFILIFLLLLGGVGTADADIYRWRDSNGVVHYSDRKPNGEHDVIKQKQYKQTEQQEVTEDFPQERSTDTIKAKFEQLQSEIEDIFYDTQTNSDAVAEKLNLRFIIDSAGKMTDCHEDTAEITVPGINGQICQRVAEVDYGRVLKSEPVEMLYQFTFNRTRPQDSE